MNLHLCRTPFVAAFAASISIAIVEPAAGQQDPATIFPIPQVSTTGMIGIAEGDSVRLNALNPGVPAPFLGSLCFVQLAFVDDQNRQLNGGFFRVLPGFAVSLTLNADSDVTLGRDGRLEIRGEMRVPPLLTPPPPDVLPIPVNNVCRLVGTVEVFNNETGRTRVVLPDFHLTFPFKVLPPPQPTQPTSPNP